MRLTALILAFVLGGLVFTNPGMESFEAYVEDEASQLIRDEIGDDSWLTDAIGSIGGSALSAQAESFTTRSNYLLASTYTVDLNDDGHADLQWLGIAGRFIQLDPDDE